MEKKSHFEAVECSNVDCFNVFIPKTYNGIFCSAECRRISTNKKILSKYYEAKENKTKKRTCVTESCTTILSRYNKEDICEACKVERYIKRLTSWGWSEDQLREEFK